MRCEVRVEEADFCPGDEHRRARERLSGRAGAIASFVGLVRELHDETLKALTLEHFPGMTERSIESIVRQAGARWPLLDVVVIHRVGTLEPAAQIVLVQVASAHRSAAFDACAFIMDYLKTEAVFWKREDAATGSRWVEATADDRRRVSDWSGNA